MSSIVRLYISYVAGHNHKILCGRRALSWQNIDALSVRPSQIRLKGTPDYWM